MRGQNLLAKPKAKQSKICFLTLFQNKSKVGFKKSESKVKFQKSESKVKLESKVKAKSPTKFENFSKVQTLNSTKLCEIRRTFALTVNL